VKTTLSVAESFDPRANSIGFLRWFLAFLVIFSHAGPLAGFYGGRDLGTQWSDEQSFGGVAVGGFFFLSGYLITTSRLGRASTARFFWRRVLRIMPAFWTAFLVTAFVLAPIAFLRVNGTIDGFFTATTDSPFTYISNNMFLLLGQPSIAGLGPTVPYSSGIWNGSAWTLAYEFGAYIIVGILGLVGALRYRALAASFAIGIILLAVMQWTRAGEVWRAGDLFADFRVLLLLAPFAFGMLFALFGDRIPVDDRLAVLSLLIAAATYGFGGWLAVGQYFFFYFLMWFAIRVTVVKNWERPGDFSYGVYIFAWPVQQFVAYFGVHTWGWVAYHVIVVAIVHVLAYLSWHLIENPAISLKNWTPRWLERLLTRSRERRANRHAARQAARDAAEEVAS
jgi:peptidoglycan/LPS O-acetylase OafA/YrhL